LIDINFLGAGSTLVTHGPFNYVRHPLYSTVMLTVPPLLIIWFADLLFLVPWFIILVFSHYVVAMEERALIKSFGADYERYRTFVPSLLPYKGNGGTRYRRRSEESAK
jgi:protein-S-isoprenylcysteine O-methyltransferase Ste14